MNEDSSSPEPTLRDVTSSSNAGARGGVDWQPAFLKALENVGVICKAAEAAGISTMQVWRARKDNPEFATAFEEALGCGALLLEQEAIRRAKDGVRRIPFNPKTGEPYKIPGTDEIYVEHVFSDALMAMVLKRHIPAYREKPSDVHVSTTLNNIAIFTEDKQREWQERHREALM